MNRNTITRKLTRVALILIAAFALTAAYALFLPTNIAATGTLPAANDGMTSSAARLDGLAQSLMTRPAALLTSADRRALADSYSDQIIARHTDLEAFARSAEFAAALSAGSVDEFVKTLSYLTLDARDNWTAIAAGPWTRVLNRIHNALPLFPNGEALLRYGSQGFAYDDKSNQPQHFWYSVAITYKYGPHVALAIARYHEWNPPALLRWLPGTGNGRGADGDMRLSQQGIALGLMLRSNSIRPEGVGEWMRDELD